MNALATVTCIDAFTSAQVMWVDVYLWRHGYQQPEWQSVVQAERGHASEAQQ